MATKNRDRRIERSENKIAHLIGILRHVEVLAALAETDEERDIWLQVLRQISRLKIKAIDERKNL